MKIFLFLACQTSEPEAPKERLLVVPGVEEGEVLEPEVEQQSNRPPIISSAEFTNGAPKFGDEIKAQIEATDPDGDDIDIEYTWKINGKLQASERREFLRKAEPVKGDEILLTATATDGDLETEKQLSVTIQNTPPAWQQDPKQFKSIVGHSVRASDADGDVLTYRLEGAPKGMAIDPAQGLISYLGAADEPGGNYTVTIVAEDDDKASVKWSFSIEISAGSGSKK